MKSFRKSILFVALTVLVAANFALAAPSLDVTKGPVIPVPSWTGPPNDPHAKAGQWFLNMDGTVEVRSHEFYDNVPGFGGGSAASKAIEGYVVNVQMGSTAAHILAFDIVATITNDTPGEGEWRIGGNSHSERLSVDDQYKGTLYDTKLTAEFAVDGPSLTNWLATMPGMVPGEPYRLWDPQIVAVEPDELAWYCWTPDNPDQQTPYGAFLVPTYDFGDILPGQSVTRTLSFKVGGVGISPNDPRYEVLLSQDDIFLNRTTSLKVSNWVDTVGIDNGAPYPADTGEYNARLNSDVSVFHTIPEPGTLVLLLLGLAAVFAGRRRDG